MATPKKSTRFYWVVIADSHVCPDCLRIAAMQPREGRTLAEWLRIGLPGSGHTVCGGSCRCILIEVEYVDSFGELEIDKQFIYLKAGEIAPPPAQVINFYDLLFKARMKNLITADFQKAIFNARSVADMVTLLEELLGQAVA